MQHLLELDLEIVMPILHYKFVTSISHQCGHRLQLFHIIDAEL